MDAWYDHHLQQQSIDQPGKVANPARGQVHFSCPRSCPRIWSRGTGSTVPFLVTHGIPPAFRDGVHLYPEPTSGQSRVYHVTHLRTDGVHCRESSATGPAVLEVVSVAGAAFAGFILVHFFVCVSVFSSHPFWTSMDVPAGVTQEEGHTGFLIHLPSAVRALIFVARRIQPFLSLVDREVEFCVLTN